MGERVLESDNLTKDFDGVVAVDRLSFTIDQGEIVGLLGVNGAGKTTAMNMILGLTKPSSGNIRAFGLDLFQHRIAILRRSNFSSAYADLPNNLLVWQNLLVFGKLYGVKNLKEKIDSLLELFEISHLRDRVTGRLSAGESTRLHLCKSLLNDPELLLLDEPTASLDPDIADKVRKIIRRVQSERGIAILYTSHNMRDVEEVCDRVVFIHKGKIICTGTPTEVVDHFQKDSLEDVFISVARSGEMKEQTERQAHS
ncbi:MAG: ABC transporter ATP-binding protein [Verrucomicrobiota bacterium]